MSGAIRIQHTTDGQALTVDPAGGNGFDIVPGSNWRDPNKPNVQSQQSGSHRVTYQDGKVTYEDTSVRSASATVIDPTRVTIGGIETSREVAEAMGLLDGTEQEGPGKPRGSLTGSGQPR